jgi:methionyl-tRNA formyltransferase
LSLTLVFMGTPDFSVPILDALIDAGHRVAAVYSQPPRPAGRGHKPHPTPVAAFAESRALPLQTPVSLRSSEQQSIFESFAADAAVVAAYGLILPPSILTMPKRGCLNVHASLLPRWRGAAPIERAIEAGDPVSGVTIMQMDAGLDTGATLLRQCVPITAAMTAGDLRDRLSGVGAELMVTALAALEQGMLTATPQPAAGVTYAAKLKKQESQCDWRRPADELERRLRAFTPGPGLWFEHRGERCKVVRASVQPGQAAPGEVLDDAMTVACGQAALRLEIIQRAGRAAMPADVFLRGFPIAAGERLSVPCPATN